MATAVQHKTGRALIAPALFDRLTQRITTDHPDIEQPQAEQILDQALAFLGTCATTTQPIGPSDLVDIGWHTFLMYTRDYADFCQQVAGRFIHHAPDDEPGTSNSTPLSVTMAAIKAAGYQLDPALWPNAADCNSGGGGSCNQCYAGCSNSPSH